MFKNKALSCMLALGLTVAAAPAVLAGPNDTAGNTGVVDKTENPEDAPTQPPGEESSGATSTEGTSTEGSTEGTTDGTTSTEGTTPEGETSTEGTTTPEGETPTEGSTSTEGATTPEGTTSTEGATTPEGTTSTEGTTTPESTTEGTTSSGSSLPQTGAPVVLLAPVLAAGGVAGYSLYKKSH